MAASLQNTSSLTINVEDLLNIQGVEKQRVEFKKSWQNNGKQSRGTYWQVLHTICAFANDFYNDNGGYIIIGVEEEEAGSGKKRQAKLPPCGIPGAEMDRIQKEIMGACRTNIKPDVYPILSPEVVQGVHVLVIWTTASDGGPHQCREAEKGPSHYYIRQGPETKKANAEEKTQVLQQSNKTPFDDRMARDHGIPSYNGARGDLFIRDTGKQLSTRDISRSLVNSFLDSVRSNLRGQPLTQMILYQNMKLVTRYGDHTEDGKLKATLVPRNVALLFFNQNPENNIPGAKMEIARYTQDRDVIEVKTLTGPIHEQIKNCLKFVLQQTSEEVSDACLTYPERALREAVVNAVYHRGYETNHPDPIKVHIYPDHIEIISYPGPHSSLKPEHFQEGNGIPPVPARNRRIGEFLKELKLAEARGTGVNTIFKTMKRNENPPPTFFFDPSYFLVKLPAHPKYTTYAVLAAVDRLVAKGEKEEAVESLMKFLDEHPDMLSEALVCKLFELHEMNENHPNVLKYQRYFAQVFEGMMKRMPLMVKLQDWSVQTTLDVDEGVRIIKEQVEQKATSVELAPAIFKAVDLCSNANNEDLTNVQDAHKLFQAMGPEMIASQGNLAYEYGCCKYHIYRLNKRKEEAQHGPSSGLLPYLTEADEFLKKAVQLTSKGWRNLLAYRYRMLYYVHFELFLLDKSTATDCEEYYKTAKELKPDIEIEKLEVPWQTQSRRRKGGKNRSKK